jgi:uncharacterized membrane protein
VHIAANLNSTFRLFVISIIIYYVISNKTLKRKKTLEADRIKCLTGSSFFKTESRSSFPYIKNYLGQFSGNCFVL